MRENKNKFKFNKLIINVYSNLFCLFLYYIRIKKYTKYVKFCFYFIFFEVKPNIKKIVFLNIFLSLILFEFEMQPKPIRKIIGRYIHMDGRIIDWHNVRILNDEMREKVTCCKAIYTYTINEYVGP